MSFYKQDPNDSQKQVTNIGAQPILKRVGYAVAVPALSMSKRPTYVVINQPGTYAFAYESGSVSTYITSSVISGDADRGNPAVKLDINPMAWRQTDDVGGIGDVTFVYRRIS